VAQAIANLLINAAKYTEPGGTITVSARAEGDDALVSVRDSGVGIAPDLLPRIFDLFVQGASSLDRSQGGMGIGLTVAKSLVDLHGGTMTAHSAGVGQGSEFVIRLPRVEVGAGVAPAASPSAAASPAGDSRRVLVVDDNLDGAEMLGKVLEVIGCAVRVVHDGASAVAEAEAFRPQLVLLDIGLPGMDGYTVARRLRASQAEPTMKIVAVTGYGQPSDRARSREGGFDEHIPKPIDLGTLRRLLEDRIGSTDA
jgi:CheY-like chemotaxis protein